MFPSSVDVLIVGAGLAGLEAARLFAEGGRRVLLIDRKLSLSRIIHTSGIFTRSLLEDWDVPGSLFGPAIRRVVLYSPALRAVTFDSSADEFRIARMGDLYSHLLHRAREAGVMFASQTAFESLRRTDNGSIVTLQSGEVEARYVIGADGARSRVAPALGLSANKRFLLGAEIVVRTARAGVPRLECFLDPKLAPGYIAWVAHDGVETHVGTAGDPGRLGVHASLQAFAARVGVKSEDAADRRGGLIPIGGVLRRIVNQHGLLIGDAAGAVSPLTAGGFEGSVRTARIAAAAVLDFLRSGDEAPLRAYATAATIPLWKVGLRTAFDWIEHPALFEAGCRLLAVPLFKSVATRVFFGRSAFSSPRVPLASPPATAKRWPASEVSLH